MPKEIDDLTGFQTSILWIQSINPLSDSFRGCGGKLEHGVYDKENSANWYWLGTEQEARKPLLTHVQIILFGRTSDN
jgi:hypothetical protein